MNVNEREEFVPNIFEPPSQPAVYNATIGSSRRYPVCHMLWGNPSKEDKLRLSVVDLAVLADAVYYTYEDEVMSLVTNATHNTDLEGVELEFLEEPETLGRWGVFTFKKSG